MLRGTLRLSAAQTVNSHQRGLRNQSSSTYSTSAPEAKVTRSSARTAKPAAWAMPATSSASAAAVVASSACRAESSRMRLMKACRAECATVRRGQREHQSAGGSWLGKARWRLIGLLMLTDGMICPRF